MKMRKRKRRKDSLRRREVESQSRKRKERTRREALSLETLESKEEGRRKEKLVYFFTFRSSTLSFLLSLSHFVKHSLRLLA